MLSRPGENELIATFAPLAGPAGLGLKDDAPLLASRLKARTSC